MRRGVVVPAVTGVLLLAGGLLAASGWVDWLELWRWLRPRVAWFVVFGAASGLLAMALIRGVRRAEGVRTASALSWRVVGLATAVVAGVAWGVTAWLLWEADRAKDPAAARVEAIKTGLSIGAGTGGAFALLLAVRRQRHLELASTANELDATERRVTELYTKAVDQLGSDKAPVRLGGLYALERVGQSNPLQRQTIVNVICAYLRVPYVLPGDPPDLATLEQTEAREYRERIQEREVRLAAQRLLAAHLGRLDSSDTFWKDIDLDLSRAILLDLNLTDCRLNTVTFAGAHFTGDASFLGAEFTGDVSLDAATFTGDARFSGAKFTRNAVFDRARFNGHAYFEGTEFGGHGFFEETEFTEVAWFGKAKFAWSPVFLGASFNRGAAFRRATFAQEVPDELTRFIDDTRRPD